eukprot:TRINITY_DN14176_c1_g1_i1.p1 TRINITY_DN14176_c1_g1~~TRINITY_DN14176_c1_g1_i1.p1  ORF type:complete len:108 (+),score=7.16 TRINITY_DN14176_c1_g1_i1:1160-1483(+)
MRLQDYKSFEVIASAITVIITQFSTYRACCTLPTLPITSKNEQNISKLMKYNEIEHDLCKEIPFQQRQFTNCTRVFRILHPLKKKYLPIVCNVLDFIYWCLIERHFM